MDASTDPIRQFETWLADAEKTEPNDANAMSVATVTADGQPSVRILLLKGVEDGAFQFFTNYQSRKGRELETGRAALCFHWKTLRRQVRVVGTVEKLPPDASDAYFATRERGSQIGAHASQQSQPLASREALVQAVSDVEAHYDGKAVPRPAHWGGYRLVPAEIEFWMDQPFRLHDRFRFTRAGAGWQVQRLFP
ncbi:MAG: pyridoxamine 5'-phosphate oxidase [Alphaproteobacteria bacterium]|nr:pyridoxamine 5'-phosphate oxidase [Alphaproteobacteria bacterium]MCB9928017.1 pyridoxamine 5'-phosphate oxidase [Alphaproteobacteria bacterium]